MATFTHVTAERCAQLGRALTAAGLTWSDDGRQAKPQYFDHTQPTRRAPWWSSRRPRAARI